jgi:hypothetical protein
MNGRDAHRQVTPANVHEAGSAQPPSQRIGLGKPVD